MSDQPGQPMTRDEIIRRLELLSRSSHLAAKTASKHERVQAVLDAEAIDAALAALRGEGWPRKCLMCEGHGVKRKYLDRAGLYEKSHCESCDGAGNEPERSTP
jgi:hypothetical protein